MAAAGVGMFYVNEDSGTNEDALEAVKVALTHGADVNAADDKGDTPLHGGAWRGSNAIVRLPGRPRRQFARSGSTTRSPVK